MREKILSKLKDQRGKNLQITDKTLEAKADVLSSIITDDEMLAKVDFTSELESMQGNIGYIAKGAVEDFKSKLPEPPKQQDLKPQDPKPNTDTKSDMPEWAKAMIDELKETKNELANIKGEKITSSRSEKLTSILKDAPESYKKQVLKSFSKMNFENDEDFAEYVTETENNLKEHNQMLVEQGLPKLGGERSKGNEDLGGRDATLASASKVIADAKAKAEKN